MPTLETLRRQLTALSGSLDAARHTPTRPSVERFLQDAHGVLRHVKGVEGIHITHALSSGSFPFERAQAQLQGCVRRLAVLISSPPPGLTPEESSSLEELAFLACHAPRASAATLASIRQARAG